jgi:serine/threonine-protein kinase
MYMAPERLTTRGQSGPRVDIYALGAVAFFLLTGRDIFDMNSPDALLEQVLHAVPPRVSTLIQQPIPEALDRLVEACLAKQPQDRPESMQEVLEALDALA